MGDVELAEEVGSSIGTIAGSAAMSRPLKTKVLDASPVTTIS
jgi:hypothetical protein